MTIEQEDLLYDFLENTKIPFTIKDAASYARGNDRSVKQGALRREIADLFTSRKVVFPYDDSMWISRYGYFYNSVFVIKPSRLELVNGILIPGHRCVPFANPFIMSAEYTFYYKNKLIESTSSEGDPQEFYPFFSIYGEEYAPQYIARDNTENETAFNCDPSCDPPEVSLKTIDMRRVYRECFFKPEDIFIVTIRDWKTGSFNIEKREKKSIDIADLDEWQEIAEDGFCKSFEQLGPSLSTEIQIAWAYFYGGKRMCRTPAYSLEYFIFEKSDKIDITSFGLETRFWFAGKEIADFKSIVGLRTQSDDTPIEKMLLMDNIPISEFVVQAYVKDAFFRNDTDVGGILERIAPPAMNIKMWHEDYLAAYIINEIEDAAASYSVFRDQKKGPVRQQAAELHTAVMSLAARISKGEIDISILPKHTFIILSQIQIYCAGILEDIDAPADPTENELLTIENSMENMIDVFDDLKDMIDRARSNFRRNNISLVTLDDADKFAWRTVQISIGGTDIWRRVCVPENLKLGNLEKIIYAVFNWSGSEDGRWLAVYVPNFGAAGKEKDKHELQDKTIKELFAKLITELTFEYGKHWTVKIIIQAYYDTDTKQVKCIAGSGCAPNEAIEGPLRLRRFVNALSCDNEKEKKIALKELGADFVPLYFNMDECNKKLSMAIK